MVIASCAEAAEAMVIVKGAFCVNGGLLESVALNVREVLATVAVGVPAIEPVAGFSDNPAGSVPETSAQE